LGVSLRWLWRMLSSGKLRRVALVRMNIPPKRRFLQEPHTVTSQKTAFFKIKLGKSLLLTQRSLNANGCFTGKCWIHLHGRGISQRGLVFAYFTLMKIEIIETCLPSMDYTTLYPRIPSPWTSDPTTLISLRVLVHNLHIKFYIHWYGGARPLAYAFILYVLWNNM
jgi:hypothetical protein